MQLDAYAIPVMALYNRPMLSHHLTISSTSHQQTHQCPHLHVPTWQAKESGIGNITAYDYHSPPSLSPTMFAKDDEGSLQGSSCLSPIGFVLYILH